MPFTPCHVLAVVPFRKRLPWLALVIGAMIPDFGYFFPWTPYFYESAHTLPRLFTFCLPVGLALFVLVRAIRPGWIQLVPQAWALPMSDISKPWDWVRVAVALFLGALTHFFWDSWTHPYGYFVQRWPEMPYKWLQHLSTFTAAVILGSMLLRRFGRELWAFTPAQLRYWSMVAVLAVLFGWLRFASPEHSGLTGQRSLFILVTSTIGSALSVVAVSSATLACLKSGRGHTN